MKEKGRDFLKAVSEDRIILGVKTASEGNKLGRESGLFYAPEVKDYNIAEGWIRFEYLHDLVPLRSIKKKPELMTLLIEKAAKALVYIHDNFKLDKRDIVLLPLEIEMPGKEIPRAFLHGDFNTDNVQFDPASQGLVILDWSLSPLFDKPATWGTVYWDVLWFARGILGLRYYMDYHLAFRHNLVRIFMEQYQEHSGYKLVEQDLKIYSKQLLTVMKTVAKKNIHWYNYARYMRNFYSLRDYIISSSFQLRDHK
jgi:hypothetical protein